MANNYLQHPYQSMNIYQVDTKKYKIPPLSPTAYNLTEEINKITVK